MLKMGSYIKRGSDFEGTEEEIYGTKHFLVEFQVYILFLVGMAFVHSSSQGDSRGSYNWWYRLTWWTGGIYKYNLLADTPWSENFIEQDHDYV